MPRNHPAPGAKGDQQHDEERQLVLGRKRCCHDHKQPLAQVEDARPKVRQPEQTVQRAVPDNGPPFLQHTPVGVETVHKVNRDADHKQGKRRRAHGKDGPPRAVKAENRRVGVQHKVVVGELDAVKEDQRRPRHGNVENRAQDKDRGVQQGLDVAVEERSPPESPKDDEEEKRGHQNGRRDADRDGVLEVKGGERALGGKQRGIKVKHVEPVQNGARLRGPADLGVCQDAEHLTCYH